jgi:hypothetical protein
VGEHDRAQKALSETGRDEAAKTLCDRVVGIEHLRIRWFKDISSNCNGQQKTDKKLSSL